MLKGRLSKALVNLNPGAPPEAIQTAVDELVRAPFGHESRSRKL